MTWEILNIIGTLAFAISGALVATEEEFDIFGVFILGFTTAFGGGLIRNLLIGLPIEKIWQQDLLFIIAFLVILLVFLFPNRWMNHWKRWVILFDAIGLGAFAIQGANYAVSIDAPLIAVVVAAILTGAGGGMLRDVFAGRKPMIFRSDIYALWAALAGVAIGFDLVHTTFSTFLLLALVVVFRMLSVYFHWNLPRSINWDRQKKLRGKGRETIGG
ncbi:trimeric intracellular cation channel family protein [Bacillus kwashiorkori]|uniref:trimeric intracellular cation channel family protein n=1 Tax=Bacillus kwashiorkori TaxID=1522318 RepID=UPI0007832A60|nr:trimeric intracellular cation channel family protein [Bacillus kwashiorkori]